MKNIILTGMMGCGKSTIAALLGQTLSRPVVDTDDLVEAQAGMAIAEIFKTQGEQAMRDLETEVCRQLSQTSGCIIATGGGLPLRAENRAYLRESGTVFFLNRDPGEIYDTGDMSLRPLGQQGREAFLQRFQAREPIYRAFAHRVIEEFSTPQATQAAILSALEESL